MGRTAISTREFQKVVASKEVGGAKVVMEALLVVPAAAVEVMVPRMAVVAWAAALEAGGGDKVVKAKSGAGKAAGVAVVRAERAARVVMRGVATEVRAGKAVDVGTCP